MFCRCFTIFAILRYVTNIRLSLQPEDMLLIVLHFDGEVLKKLSQSITTCHCNSIFYIIRQIMVFILLFLLL